MALQNNFNSPTVSTDTQTSTDVMNSSNSSTASLLPSSSTVTPSKTQKDYLAAFGDLQDRYGMGSVVRSGPIQAPAPLPSASAPTQKWYKWHSRPKSSSPPSYTPQTRTPSPKYGSQLPSETQAGKAARYEDALGDLMTRYGQGPGGAFGYGRCKH